MVGRLDDVTEEDNKRDEGRVKNGPSKEASVQFFGGRQSTYQWRYPALTNKLADVISMQS